MVGVAVERYEEWQLKCGELQFKCGGVAAEGWEE